jgi:hypothetical protein
MNITIIEKKTKKQKGSDGKEVETVETSEHEFETHPHELIGSAALRYAKDTKMPAPPPGLRATLKSENRIFSPDITVKESGCTKFSLTGIEKKAV